MPDNGASWFTYQGIIPNNIEDSTEQATPVPETEVDDMEETPTKQKPLKSAQKNSAEMNSTYKKVPRKSLTSKQIRENKTFTGMIGSA